MVQTMVKPIPTSLALILFLYILGLQEHDRIRVSSHSLIYHLTYIVSYCSFTNQQWSLPLLSSITPNPFTHPLHRDKKKIRGRCRCYRDSRNILFLTGFLPIKENRTSDHHNPIYTHLTIQTYTLTKSITPLVPQGQFSNDLQPIMPCLSFITFMLTLWKVIYKCFVTQLFHSIEEELIYHVLHKNR